MGSVVRCILFIIGVTVWLMLAYAEGSLSSNRARGQGRRRHATINRWYLEEGVSETPYTECPGVSTVGKLMRVEVEGCDDDPCHLHAGSSATFHLSFVPSVSTEGVKAIVHGVIGVVPVPFHVPHPNACEDCGLECPLESGQHYNYTTTIPVLGTYPRIGVKVKWELVTSDNKDLVCILIPAKIV